MRRRTHTWALRAALAGLLGLLVLTLAVTPVALAGWIGLPLLVGGPQAPAPTVFAVIGDFGVDDSEELAVQRLVDTWSPGFVVTTGDNFYNPAMDPGDTGNKYHEAVGKYYCRYLKEVAGAGACQSGAASVNAFFPSMGNHDYHDATPGPQTYTGYFTLPGLGVLSSRTSGNERYYDFVQGPVHFFVLNSNLEEPDGSGAASAQARWLEAQLAASTSPWNIVVFHHAPYSSDTAHGSTVRMQLPFAKWGADVVLSGHAHTYERVMRDGIVYFVNGLGGASRHSFGPPIAGSAARYDDTGGAQRVTATATSLKFEFISVDGVTRDVYTLEARPDRKFWDINFVAPLR